MAQGLDIAGFAAQTLGGSYGNPEPTLVRNKGTYIGQCVSLERQALSAIDGVNFGSLGNAVDYSNSTAQAKYASIGYTWMPGDTNFVEGDVLVYGNDSGSMTGPEGHIARWYQGKLLNQNYGGSLKVTQNNFFSAGYLGRYTKGENMIQDTDEEYARWALTSQFTRARTDDSGKLRPLTRQEFKDNAVGKTWLSALEILEDADEASHAMYLLQTGFTAVDQKWVPPSQASDEYIKVSDLYIKKES